MSLDNPETTVELLRANAVIGVTGFFDKEDKRLRSIGIQCASAIPQWMIHSPAASVPAWMVCRIATSMSAPLSPLHRI